MFKNMKIAITPEQPLDEVVRELERLGYKKRCATIGKPRFVSTETSGFYDVFFIDHYGCREVVALAELKEMK